MNFSELDVLDGLRLEPKAGKTAIYSIAVSAELLFCSRFRITTFIPTIYSIVRSKHLSTLVPLIVGCTLVANIESLMS